MLTSIDRLSKSTVRLVWLMGLAALMGTGGGCAAPMPVRATSCDIRVNLDPVGHSLTGEAALQLVRVGDQTRQSGAAAIAFELHPDLTVTAVDCNAARVRQHSINRGQRSGSADEPGPVPAIHRVTLDRPADDFTLTVRYSGKLHQDAGAGEKRGEIHNFLMSAHIDTNGVYLSESGGWYPTPLVDAEADPERALTEYHLAIDRVEGFEMVAAMEPDVTSGNGMQCWESARPQTGIALTGARRVRLSAEHDGVMFHALVSPGKEALGKDLIACAKNCYDRYVPLLGPYPFSEFTVFEGFFSSGFGFPGFAQFTPVLIGPKKMYRWHGFLDHEFVHNWFGNGVYVDPRDGNWCEALTAYCTNLLGHDLDGDATAARRQRRNRVHFLSRIKPDRDKPLGTFGEEDGAGRGIGYDKGAMVFHMLNLKIGEEAFWAGVKRITRARMGRFAGWDDLKTCFAAETDEDLGPFFEQWVRGIGAPQLEIRSAAHYASTGVLELLITQGDTEFACDVPIRIYRDADDFNDVLVPVESREEVVRLPAAVAPAVVELDPDYHLFRKVPPHCVLPTSSLTEYGDKLVILQPGGNLWPNYELIASDFEKGNGAEHTVRVRDTEVAAETLADTGVLILGDAVRHPVVLDLLSRADCPVTWEQDGFTVDNKTYADPSHAVFATMRHPDNPKRGITVYYGNSEGALANAGLLSHYSNSLLVFGAGGSPPLGMGTAMGKMGRSMGATKVLYREDIETRPRVPVVCK